MPTLFNDEIAGLKTPDSGILDAPSSGIGIAPAQSAPAKEPSQGVFGHVQRFLFGVSDADLRRKREKESELKSTEAELNALKLTLEVANELDGDARTKFLQQRGSKLEKTFPGISETLTTLGNDPDTVKLLLERAEQSPTLATAIRTGGMKAGRQLLKSVEGLKTVSKEIEVAGLPRVREKIKGIVTNWQQLLPPEMNENINKDGVVTLSELIQGSDYIANHENEKYRKLSLTPADLAILSRNEEALLGQFGILTGKKQEEVLADRAKKAGDKDLKSGKIVDLPLGGKEFAKAAYDPDGKLFPDAEHDKNGFAILGKGTKEGVSITFPTSSGFGVNPDTGEEGHYSIGKNGTIRWDKVQKSPKEQEPLKEQIAVSMRFGADPSMKGKTLGSKTNKGFEVKDKSGKVIGYYR